MAKITIIDGYSLLFRAYYATAYPGIEIMRSQDGTPTNAIFAFSNMINKILSNIKQGECFFVAFDTKGQTFRKEALDSYKANRKPVPEDLITQFPIVREFITALNVYQFEKEGYEGDDIAGTVARLAEQQGYEVTIYTSDRDYLQLVSDKVTVNIIRKGLSDVVPMTPQLVLDTYGFKPLQIIDYKGLRGDSSDNLPGIPGIGEKTAVKLIQQYDSFDNIVSHSDEIGGKVGQMLKEHQDIGKISRDLAIIKTDIELPFTIDDTIYQGYSFEEINTFCQKYGLKQFINKVTPKWKTSNDSSIDLKVNEVKSFSNINIDKEIGIAVDYSGDYFYDSILGISIVSKDEAYYIDVNDLKNDQTLISILENEQIDKYCYDYKAIKVALSKLDINIKGLKFDILIASYLLDSSMKNNPELVMNAFGVDIGKEETISLLSPNNKDKVAKIAYFSLKLKQKVFDELNKVNAVELYNALELPLIITLADVEIEGFPLDKNVLDDLGNIYKEKVKALEEEIYQLAGVKFNVASPKQVGEVLFDKLGLSSNKKLSTSFDTLKEIKDEHPIVNKILEHRKYSKLVSTYTDGLKPFVYEDGKIHAHFNQALTTTGRLSSSNPNLQNISVRDEEGKNIRKAFYYPNYEYEILSLDYSQIELRILADLSNCEALKEIFISGEDIHTATAKKVFHLEGEPTSLQRRKAKAVNFGIIYGISDWGLADQLEITNKEAREIINNFYESFPEVSNFFINIVEEAKKNGYVSTINGRRRYLREIYDSNYQVREFAKRAAMNAPIQGTAADLIKIAMIKVDNLLKAGNYKTRIISQIHDELIFKVPKEEKDIVYKLIKNEMEHAVSLSVPLEVDGGYGIDWYSAK